MKCTAKEVYRKLVEDGNLKDLSGTVAFSFGGVSVVLKNHDMVGNVIQEWLGAWLKAHDIDFEENENTQMPPDFYLAKDHTKGLLELKTFNYDAGSPAFDIANFKAFMERIAAEPYCLDADYLILGYRVNFHTGDIVIPDAWLKKIWEISCSSAKWPLKVQYKNGNIYNIRPAKWYSEKVLYKAFESKEHFLSALFETARLYSDTASLVDEWKKKFQKSYKKYYDIDVNIPRWKDIKDKYLPAK